MAKAAHMSPGEPDRFVEELSAKQLIVPLLMTLFLTGVLFAMWAANNLGEKFERQYESHIDGELEKIRSLVGQAESYYVLALQDIANMPSVRQAVMQPEASKARVADLLSNTALMGEDQWLALFDFSGAPIYTSRINVDYVDDASLARVLSSATHAVFELRSVAGRNYWLLCVPVTVNGLVEGALVAEIEFTQMFKNRVSDHENYVEFMRPGVSEPFATLGVLNSSYGENRSNLDVASRMWKRFDIELQFYHNRENILAEERRFAVDTALAFLFIGMVTLFLAHRLSQRFATRLIEERNATAMLYEQVQQANAKLEEAISEAGRANRHKSEFLANMSHEIRTPMNAILGMTELLLDTPLQESQQNDLQVVRHSARSLLNILNDILDLSKVEAGKMSLESIEFSLREVLDNLNQVFLLRAESKGLKFKVDVASNVPERLVGDPTRIRQVITNLLGNAIKFTGQGSVYLHVNCASIVDQIADLRVLVRDTGVGIAKKNQEEIFSAFTQADGSITRKYGGTGLGLSISQQLISMMGGEMSLQSVEGKGSTFSFNLFIGVADDAVGSEDTASVVVPQLLKQHEISSRRILLVEDNFFNQVVTTGLLKKHGYILEVANNGEECLDMLDRGQYDCVLMDIQMAVMDGVEATHAIRRREEVRGGHIPIIGLSAHAMTGDREHYMAEGMDGYATKPVEIDKLVGEIESVLSEVVASAAPGDSAQSSRVDVEAVLEMIGGDRELLLQLVGNYLAAQEQHRVDIEAAVDQQDAEALLVATGSLRSPMQTLQLVQSLNHLDVLGAMCQTGDLTDARARWELLNADIDIDVAALRDIVAREAGDGAGEASSPVQENASAQVAVDSLLDLVGGDRQMFAQLADAFLVSYERNLNDLVQAVDEGDGPALAEAVYVLKTSLAMLQLEQVNRRIEVLEKMGKENAMENARQELEQLAKELKDCADALKTAAAAS